MSKPASRHISCQACSNETRLMTEPHARSIDLFTTAMLCTRCAREFDDGRKGTTPTIPGVVDLVRRWKESEEQQRKLPKKFYGLPKCNCEFSDNTGAIRRAPNVEIPF